MTGSLGQDQAAFSRNIHAAQADRKRRSSVIPVQPMRESIVNRRTFKMTVDAVADGTVHIDNLKIEFDFRVRPDERDSDRVISSLRIPVGGKFILIHVAVRVDRTQFI